MCFILWLDVVYNHKNTRQQKSKRSRPKLDLIEAILCSVINVVLDWVRNQDARQLGVGGYYFKSKIYTVRQYSYIVSQRLQTSHQNK